MCAYTKPVKSSCFGPARCSPVWPQRRICMGKKFNMRKLFLRDKSMTKLHGDVQQLCKYADSAPINVQIQRVSCRIDKTCNACLYGNDPPSVMSCYEFESWLKFCRNLNKIETTTKACSPREPPKENTENSNMVKNSISKNVDYVFSPANLCRPGRPPRVHM